MARPVINIPIYEDLKSLKTLVEEGLTHQEISNYFTERGYPVSRRAIGDKIKEAGL